MKKKKKQKKLLLLASVLAVIALIAGTFAWLTAQDQRVNRLESLAISDGSVQINENFDPTPIQAGGSATKEVSVTNGGSAPVYVRVSFEEVLKYLKNGAVEKDRNTKWTADTTNNATTAGVGVDVPVEVNPASGKYTGWTDITAKVKDTATGTALATGVKVLGKGSYTYNAATNKYIQEFDYVMYSPFTIGSTTKYQKVTGTLNVTNTGTAPTTEADWDYEIDPTTIKYFVYESGYDFNVVNWAEGIIPGQKGDGTASDPDAVTGTALLGAKGVRYGKDFDYRNQTATGLIPDATLTAGTPKHLLAAGNYPDGSTAKEKLPAQADNVSVLGNKISLKYAIANIVDNTGLADAKWVYNPEDGWFYFTSPLGTGKTTPDLLRSVEYASTMDKEYSNATYDLVVKMEAMQYVDEALEGSDGFNLSHLSTVSTTIANQMKGAAIY